MYFITRFQGEDPLAVTFMWYSTGRVTARYLESKQKSCMTSLKDGDALFNSNITRQYFFSTSSLYLLFHASLKATTAFIISNESCFSFENVLRAK